MKMSLRPSAENAFCCKHHANYLLLIQVTQRVLLCVNHYLSHGTISRKALEYEGTTMIDLKSIDSAN